MWTDIFYQRTLGSDGPRGKKPLLLPEPPKPDPQLLKLSRWLSDHLPNKAVWTFPFEQVFTAFQAGQTIKLRVVQVSKLKKSVELWIDQ